MTSPLSALLHAVTQALLVPVLALLLASAVYLAYQAGIFLMEWRQFRALRGADPLAGPLAPRLRRLVDAAGGDAVCAERVLVEEELALARRTERTDLLVRLGPVLGLAGTLIPLGPGLAALGRGEVQLLAGALIVAFDTTVVGLLIGGIALVLSAVRRRWYETYLHRATALLEDRLNESTSRVALQPGIRTPGSTVAPAPTGSPGLPAGA